MDKVLDRVKAQERVEIHGGTQTVVAELVMVLMAEEDMEVMVLLRDLHMMRQKSIVRII